jgi:hypothetical protein
MFLLLEAELEHILDLLILVNPERKFKNILQVLLNWNWNWDSIKISGWNVPEFIFTKIYIF